MPPRRTAAGRSVSGIAAAHPCRPGGRPGRATWPVRRAAAAVHRGSWSWFLGVRAIRVLDTPTVVAWRRRSRGVRLWRSDGNAAAWHHHRADADEPADGSGAVG